MDTEKKKMFGRKLAIDSINTVIKQAKSDEEVEEKIEILHWAMIHILGNEAFNANTLRGVRTSTYFKSIEIQFKEELEYFRTNQKHLRPIRQTKLVGHA